MANAIDPTKPLPNPDQEKQGENTASKYANETSWKPGQSGNPNGRPHKAHSITETFKRMLGEKPEVKQALVNKILKSALEGDTVAAKMIWQYMDGMPAQSMDVTSQGEKIVTPTHFIPNETDEQPE